MHRTIESLLERGTVITDGGWGSQLQALGLSPGECPDAWNLSNPDVVGRVAWSYVEAGSDVILTNTFRSNRISLAAHGLEADTARLNRAGVEISREAAAGRALVFASMGPSGRMLVAGDVTEAGLAEAFGEQAAALAGAGADALLVETMSELAEARIAVEAAVKTGLPVVASVVFDSGPHKDRTMMGATPEQAARELVEAGAAVIGANCGVGIGDSIPVCARLRAATDRPVWMKPNAGVPELVGGEVRYRSDPAEFARQAERLVSAGASFVGGCCGTTPEFIRALLRCLRP